MVEQKEPTDSLSLIGQGEIAPYPRSNRSRPPQQCSRPTCIRLQTIPCHVEPPSYESLDGLDVAVVYAADNQGWCHHDRTGHVPLCPAIASCNPSASTWKTSNVSDDTSAQLASESSAFSEQRPPKTFDVDSLHRNMFGMGPYHGLPSTSRIVACILSITFPADFERGFSFIFISSTVGRFGNSFG